MLDLLIGTAWAQDGAAARGGGGLEMVFFFGSIVGIWYFLVIRPQSKQQKAHADMVEHVRPDFLVKLLDQFRQPPYSQET